MHVIPPAAVCDFYRNRGTLEDETRLFYVAVTRAQKYLLVSYSPGDSKQFQRRSPFFDQCTRSTWVRPGITASAPKAAQLEPRARHETPQVTLSFSELKYFFECPLSFKLRFLFGFNPPLHEALGYGNGLHDALVSRAAQAGTRRRRDECDERPGLVDRHLHTPYACPELRVALRRSGVE